MKRGLYCCVPKGASQLDGLEQHRLGLLESEVLSVPMAEVHCPETRDWNLNVAKWNRLDHCIVFKRVGGKGIGVGGGQWSSVRTCVSLVSSATFIVRTSRST